MASSVYDFFKDEISVDPPVAANPKDELYSLCDDPMTEPMKLINENLKFEDNQKLRGCFIENSGFLVVGIIGLQGVGKSSVANLFANRLVEGHPFDSPFPVQTLDSLVEGYPRTTAGVDIYITQDRIILLDTQPLLDWSLTDLHIQYNLRTQKQQQQRDEHQEVVEVTGGSSTSGKWSVDGFAEITSLQLVSFLVSVCHVVVCVQDNLSNPFVLRLIDRAFGWKPLILIDDIVTTPNFGGNPSILKGSRRQPHPLQVTAVVESEIADTKVAKPEVTAMEEEAEVAVEEEEEEGGVACENEAPESNETGLGQTPTTAVKVCTSSDAVVAAATAAPASRTGMGAVEEVAEQAEVRDFVNQLLRLTDYTASLVHVYNCAPVEAFVNPRIADDRLSAYRRLLTQAFPSRLQLASLVKMGPRILQRHALSRQKRLHEQKQQVATTTTTTSNVDMDGEIQLISAIDLTEEQNKREIPAMKNEASMEATEAEIIAECCEELEMVAKGAQNHRKGVGKPCATTTVTSVPGPISKAVPKCTAEKAFDGEDRIAALRDFSRCITEGRKTHLEPSASISSPRLFLLPATNEKGEVAFGSPTYMQCAYLLQEAILSTPRHHPAPSRSNMTELQWFEFARQTWNGLAPTSSSSSSSSSSYLSDYHRLLVSNSL
ncbi:Protein SMG9 [Taenia solium]|eukprot:TsM_000923800 transcript=TsM_000923800 gene=TsM_000923800